MKIFGVRNDEVRKKAESILAIFLILTIFRSLMKTIFA